MANGTAEKCASGLVGISDSVQRWREVWPQCNDADCAPACMRTPSWQIADTHGKLLTSVYLAKKSITEPKEQARSELSFIRHTVTCIHVFVLPPTLVQICKGRSRVQMSNISSLSDAETSALATSLLDELRCGVCQKQLAGKIARTPCLHSFCWSCGMAAVRERSSCPVCTAKVTRRQLTQAPLIEDLVASVSQFHQELVRPADKSIS